MIKTFGNIDQAIMNVDPLNRACPPEPRPLGQRQKNPKTLNFYKIFLLFDDFTIYYHYSIDNIQSFT